MLGAKEEKRDVNVDNELLPRQVKLKEGLAEVF